MTSKFFLGFSRRRTERSKKSFRFSLQKCSGHENKTPSYTKVWNKPGAYPRVEYLKGDSLSEALALITNIRLGWQGLSGMNTGFLRTFVNCGCKEFYNIGPRWKSCKNFYGRTLQNVAISLCLYQAGLSSLVFCLWGRPGACPRVEYLKGASLS
jgi:hypothetical protein